MIKPSARNRSSQV